MINFSPYEVIDGNVNNPDPMIGPYFAYDEKELVRTPFGVGLVNGVTAPDGNATLIFLKQVVFFRGVGIVVPAEGRLVQSVIQNCYIGARINSSDAELSNLKISNCRDAGIHIARDVGNGMTHRVHSYGHRVACLDEGSTIQRHDGDTYADSFIGYIGQGNETVISNTLFQHNMVADCIFKAGSSSLVNCIINSQREVLEWNKISVWGTLYGERKVSVILGNSCSVLGGNLELTNWKHPVNTYSGRSSDGIRVDGDDVIINTRISEWDDMDGSRGIVLNGPRKNIKIECNVFGFQAPNDRILVATEKCNSLDVLLKVDGYQKPIDQYIDLAAGWTGTVRIENTRTGAMTTFTKGSLH